ncbi:hypothetical protein [Actinosynnema sp. NPDC020468]|uniref:hypothetical protein n=1 Tax=Actinosynnema sp. NPDC020468 TaxID=3154488 RepID=UPI0033F40E33
MIRLLVPLVLLVVAGCSAPPVADDAGGSGPLELRLSVDEASPQRFEVVKGRGVKISVTSKKAVDVHVHGFDKLARAEDGKPAVVEFTADRTGTFDVEAHPDTLLAQLVVR